MKSKVSNQRKTVCFMILTVAVGSFIQTGCNQPIPRLGILDEIAVAYRDQVWAQRAFNLRFANCNRQYADHFRNGFCAGFSDVSNGGDGFVPALPPDQYRGFEFQCAEGANCVAAWFEGYPEGVAAAREDNAGKFHTLQTSALIDRAISQAKAPNVLPADVPVSSGSGNRTAARTPSRAPQAKPPTPPTRTAPPIPKSNPNADFPRNIAPEVAARSSATRLAPRTAQLPTPLKAKPIAPATPVVTGIPVAAPQATNRSSAVGQTSVLVPAPAPARNPFLPPIVKGTQTPVATAAPVASPALPPIIGGQSQPVNTQLPPPPVIRGKKIDPSAGVSNNEYSTPLFQSSRTASRSTITTR